MSGPHDALHNALLELESNAPVDAPPPLAAGGSRRPWWLAAGGIAAAAILVGAVIGSTLLDRQDIGQASPSPSAPTPSPSATASPSASPTPTSAPPSPSPPAEPTDPPPALEWEQVAWPEDERVSEVTYDELLGLWIAVAGRSIWTSGDGLQWSLAAVDSAGCDEDGATCDWTVNGVGRLGDRLVAAGLLRQSSSDGTALASWESDDGLTWSLTATDLPGGGQDASVAASASTVLLLAAGLSSPESGTLQHVSSDGTTWERVVGEEGIKLYDLYGDADGYVAVGEEVTFADDEYTSRPIVRGSADGRSWTTMTVGRANAGVLGAITRLPSGEYVAAGLDADRRIFTWTSNGSDQPWSVTRLGQARLSESFDLRFGTMLATPVGRAIFLGGHAEAWTSADGTSWTAGPYPPDVILVTAAAGRDRVVAFARSAGDGAAPSLWVADISPSAGD